MGKAKQVEEQKDELGFTLSDYCDMQRLKEKEGIAGNSLIGDFDITAEQVRLLNGNDRTLRKLAADCFYFANLRLLRKMAYSFLQHNARLSVIVCRDDLLHQVYVDLCCGYIKLKAKQEQIRNAIYDCFRLAAVGGLGVLADVV